MVAVEANAGIREVKDIIIVKMLIEVLIGFIVKLRIYIMSTGVLASKNAVYSVVMRVGVFMAAAVSRRRIHIEYMALRYRLVYVGAIAVLLRFVVMRLNVTEWSGNQDGLDEQKNVQAAYVESTRVPELEAEKENVERKGGVYYVGRARRSILLLRQVGWRERQSIRMTRYTTVRTRYLQENEDAEWAEYPQMERSLDEIERRPEIGQYRYTEGMKYVFLAGRVRRVARRGAVVRTREEGGREGMKGKNRKGQRIGEQLSRVGLN